MSRLARLVTCALALAWAAPAGAQTEAYYSITGVTSEYLSNAVRVKISADGAISANIDKWWSGAERNYYLDWGLVAKQTGNTWPPECYPQVDKIMLRLDRALPTVGSTAEVGKYPVSHVRFVATDRTKGGIGLEVEVVLQKRMRLRKFTFGKNDMWDAYWYDHRDPAWFEMSLSPDQRSLIITVASDRLPEQPEHRALADLPESARELQVDGDAARLRVHARNVPLGDLVEAITRTTGVPFAATGAAATRVVTAELPETTAQECAACLADGYGLALSRQGEAVRFDDAAQQAAPSQAPVASARIPLRHLKARTAASLLPNFLADSMRIDEAANALVVTGPEPLLQKVAADVATLDVPDTGVTVTATFLEAARADDLLFQLGLGQATESYRASVTPEAGGVFYSTLGALPAEFAATLRALEAEQRVRMAGTSTITVTSGKTGQIFAGLDKYVAINRLYSSRFSVEPVNAGVSLTVTPRAGRERISLTVAADTKAIDEVDPVTGLPVINTRSAAGTFSLRSGETVAIGGLRQSQVEARERKIPLLGGLPLVGRLFRAKMRTRTASELTVLLTAAITECDPPDEAAPEGTAPPDTPAPPQVLPRGEMKRW